MQKLNRVIISGGGTGGHIFPAIAIANQIKIHNPDAKILFVGAKGKMEMEKVPKAGYEIRGLNIAGLQRKLTLKNLALPFKVLGSVWEARNIIKEFKPQVAIGVGGYASAPLLYAAARMGVKTFLQEQNAFAGLTNKILGKKATQVFTAYPNMETYFGNKVKICGNPVRQSVLVEINRSSALKMFGLNDGKKTILFVGGSLGARVLNQFLKLNYQNLLNKGYQVIWQAGASYYKAHPELKDITDEGIHICAFIENMNEAYAASDIVVSRAGALAISELAQLKKASILVPSPYVADDHQNKNAEVLSSKNAALLVKENEVGDALMPAIDSLMASDIQRETLCKEITAFAMPNAASEIVKHIEEAFNMDVKKLHSVFFIGIGGIGMSALATYLLSNGVKVFGYDRQSSDLTNKLEGLGAKIQYSLELNAIQEFEKCDEHLVVYTPAVKESNPLLQHALQSLNCIKRSELLAAISSGVFTIAVAGTHGKTSTSALITHILKHSGKKICAFVGGIMRNYNSNVLSDSNPEFMILEADEFDRSFLRLNPDLAVITSVDPDHLDIYETERAFLDNFQLFVDRVQGKLIAHIDVAQKLSLPQNAMHYSATAQDSNYADGFNCFSLDGAEFKIEMPGVYNVSNTMAAIRIAQAAGLANSEIASALLSFKGVNRRFNIYTSQKAVFVDDYAHHPTEISAAIEAVNSMFSDREVVAYFQPHLFSRTKDFMQAFAYALKIASKVYLLDIYPAREEPIEGVNSAVLQALVGNSCELIDENSFSETLSNNANANAVNLVMGAGSIGLFFQKFIAKEVPC